MLYPLSYEGGTSARNSAESSALVKRPQPRLSEVLVVAGAQVAGRPKTKIHLFSVCLWRTVNTTQRITELEGELSILKMDLAQLVAQIRWHEKQVALLRAGIEGPSQLATLLRTDAILSLLRTAEGTLGPSDILTSLQAAGRTKELRKVTATLDYLMKRGLITKPDRGRHLAQ